MFAACSGADGGNDGPASHDGGPGGALSDVRSPDGTATGDGDAAPGGGTDGFVACAGGAWCWEQPRPTGNDVHGIWAASAKDIWTVGKRGTLSHYDGTSWKTTQVDDEELRGIWGSSASDIWAVGSNEVIFHYDGAAWKRVHGGAAGGVTGGAVAKSLTGIWGSAPNDIWAVTPNLSFLHYDGTTWSAAVTDYGSVGSLDCTGSDHDRIHAGIWGVSKDQIIAVSCNSTTALLGSNNRWTVFQDSTVNAYWHAVWGPPNDPWKGGSAGIYHGHDLEMSVPRGDSVSAISGTSPNDLWAVTYGGMVYHRGTSGWKSVPGSPSGLGQLAVWAGAGATLIAGAKGHLLVPSGAALVDFPGTTPLTRSSLTGIAIPNGDDRTIWVAGTTTVIRHHDGAWSVANRTSDGAPLPNEGALTTGRTIVAPDANDVWSVPGAFPYHFDGSSWTKATYTPNSGDAPVSLSATAKDDVWMVGRAQMVDHYDGTKWTPLQAFSETTLGLGCIHARTSTDVWVAAGILDSASSNTYAHVRHYNGTTWTAEEQTANGAPMAPFNRLYVPEAGNVWATSSTGIYHYAGGKWQEAHPTLPPGDTLAGFDEIDGSGPNDIWVLHRTSSRLFAVYHFDGTKWAYELPPTNEWLNAIAVGPKRIWIAGENGALLMRAR